MSDADKQARLAEALRANLRKRKTQARGMPFPAPSAEEAGNISSRPEPADRPETEPPS